MTDLPLQWKSCLDKSCFAVGASNKEAYHWINTSSWPFKNLWIYGPKGCGKSHMGSIWSEYNHGKSVISPIWPEGPLPHFIWIDVQHRTDLGCEYRLFSFLQRLQNEQCYSLWTSRYSMHHLKFALQDITSRINAMMCVQVMKPDETLLTHVLIKSLSDIGWILSDKKLQFLVARMPRSFESIAWIVDFMHQHAEPNNLSFQTLHRLVDHLEQQHKNSL